MERLVCRTGTEAQKTIEYFLVDLVTGLKKARDRGVICRCPEYVDVQITYIKELAAATETSTQTTPEVTDTQTTVNPAVTTTTTSTQENNTTQNSAGSERSTHNTLGGDTVRFEGTETT